VFFIFVPTNTPNITDDKFELAQNYPNPFNAITTIFYSLPRPEFVTLTIYDISGRVVATLIDENQPAGVNRVTWNAAGLSSGIYFYTIQTSGFSQANKMFLLK